MGRDAGCGEQTDSIDPLLYVPGRWDDGGQGERRTAKRGSAATNSRGWEAHSQPLALIVEWSNHCPVALNFAQVDNLRNNGLVRHRLGEAQLLCSDSDDCIFTPRTSQSHSSNGGCPCITPCHRRMRDQGGRGERGKADLGVPQQFFFIITTRDHSDKMKG